MFCNLSFCQHAYTHIPLLLPKEKHWFFERTSSNKDDTNVYIGVGIHSQQAARVELERKGEKKSAIARINVFDQNNEKFIQTQHTRCTFFSLPHSFFLVRRFIRIDWKPQIKKLCTKKRNSDKKVTNAGWNEQRRQKTQSHRIGHSLSLYL